MSARIHVSYHKGWTTWHVKLEGAKSFSKSFWSDQRPQAVAWAAGRLIKLGGGEVVVHERDGGVKEVWTVEKD